MKIRVETPNDEVYYPTVRVRHMYMDVVKTKPRRINSVETTGVDIEKSEPMALVDIVQKIEEPKKGGERRAVKKMWRSRLGTALVTVIAIIAVALVGLRLAGFRTFTILSGSMSPQYPVGAMIYVKPVDYKTLKVGDVISYVAGDDKTVVTHRIIEIETDGNEVWRFRTQGDANNTPDANLVHYKNVLGTPAITIPLIGFIAHNIQQPPGIYITLVVGTLLLAWTFLPGTLEGRRKTARKSIA